MKLDLLTNATVVDDAIRFVATSESEKSKDKENIKSSSGNDKEQSKEEPDYGEDKDQIEEKQEEETGEMTINQVFW